MSKKPEGVKCWQSSFRFQRHGLSKQWIKQITFSQPRPQLKDIEEGRFFTLPALAERIRLEREEERKMIAHRFDQEAVDPRTKPYWADICRWVCSEISKLKPIKP